MNSLLAERLSEINISIDEILDLIEINNPKGIFIYASHLEGLGTKKSDFDIYIICDDIPEEIYDKEFKNSLIKYYSINGFHIDAEYWKISDVYSIIEKLNEKTISLDEVKFLHRLIKGEILCNKSILNKIKDDIDINKLKSSIAAIHLRYCRGDFEDALNMYYDNDFISTIIIGRKSLDYAIAAHNTLNNKLTCKLKWTSRLLINSLGKDDKLTQKYFKLQIYSDITQKNIHSFAEELLEFIQDMISIVSLKLKD